MLNKLLLLLTFFVLFCGDIYSVKAQESFSSNQSTEKVIARERFTPETPVMIGAVKVGDTAMHFSSKPIKIDDKDWLQHLSFKVKNLTYQKIVYIRFTILFPDTLQMDKTF